MATHAEPTTFTHARDLSPYRTDYTTWKILGCAGPAFLVLFVALWGFLGRNMPPFPPNATPDRGLGALPRAQAAALDRDERRLTITSFYMAWSVAIARVMERVEGPGGVLSKLEMMGGTITCAPIMTACMAWLTAAHEVTLPRLRASCTCSTGWAGSCSTWRTSSPRLQIAACSIVFMRDKREKKLVPDAVSWWGWITFASFFVVSAIPFVTTGPLAFNGVISFWIAFFTWFFWIPSLSYFVIKAVDRIKAEDEAAGRVNA